MAFVRGLWTAVKGFAAGGLSTLRSKLGLWLGYIAIGIAIALGCAAIWFYHQTSELHEAVGALNGAVKAQDATIAQLEANNAQQDKAISDLTVMREVDSAVVKGMLEDYRRINATTADTKTKLKELEKRNEEVRAYLSAPLPASVRRVLNGQPAAAADHH